MPGLARRSRGGGGEALVAGSLIARGREVRDRKASRCGCRIGQRPTERRDSGPGGWRPRRALRCAGGASEQGALTARRAAAAVAWTGSRAARARADRLCRLGATGRRYRLDCVEADGPWRDDAVSSARPRSGRRHRPHLSRAVGGSCGSSGALPQFVAVGVELTLPFRSHALGGTVSITRQSAPVAWLSMLSASVRTSE